MKKQLVKLAIVYLFLLFSVGCAGIKLVEDRKQAPEVKYIEDYSYTIYIPFVRYSAKPLDMDFVCNKKQWKDVYLSNNFLGGLVSVFTIGIVQPQKTEVSCFN